MSAPTVPARSMSRSGSRAKEVLHHPSIAWTIPFVNGGAAGMIATSVIQPLDMVKVRLQLAGAGSHSAVKPTFGHVARDIIREDGFRALYTGISAGLLRQAVYTTTRMGVFGNFMSYFSSRASSQNRPVYFTERAAASLGAGAIGAVLGTPADLTLIRMQSDGLAPVAQRKNYSGVMNALARISKEEGVLALWKGCLPTVARAMALNFGQLAFYSETKAQLSKHKIWEGRRFKEPAQFGAASLVAGFFASAFSLPFDFVKTRLQKQVKGPDGKLPYRGSLHCAFRVMKEEGPLRFYRGFVTYYFRIAPHAMITVVVADLLLKFSK